MALNSSQCSLSILCLSRLQTVTRGLEGGPRCEQQCRNGQWGTLTACHFHTLFLPKSSKGSHQSRGHYGPALGGGTIGVKLVRSWCVGAGGLKGHQGKLLCAGCWPSPQLGIYVQLRGRLFRADAQVCEQFVIGRFMANKHIVWYTVINYINNFKIVCTSYFQHLVLLIICLPDSN